MEDDAITEIIIGCAYEVHNKLGAGFLEKGYENALRIEQVNPEKSCKSCQISEEPSYRALDALKLRKEAFVVPPSGGRVRMSFNRSSAQPSA